MSILKGCLSIFTENWPRVSETVWRVVNSLKKSKWPKIDLNTEWPLKDRILDQCSLSIKNFILSFFKEAFFILSKLERVNHLDFVNQFYHSRHIIFQILYFKLIYLKINILFLSQIKHYYDTKFKINIMMDRPRYTLIY